MGRVVLGVSTLRDIGAFTIHCLTPGFGGFTIHCLTPGFGGFTIHCLTPGFTA